MLLFFIELYFEQLCNEFSVDNTWQEELKLHYKVVFSV